MAIRANGYFNNPAFAQAASNLAGLFEPPSGADAAGWAAANAKKAEAARLADFYDYARSPDFNQQQFDRLGVGAGAYNPSQSYYNVDQGNATQRYGYDTQAATSRANNAADNARALETNRLSELGNLYDPIAQGAVRPALPEDIASQFGVSRALPAEQGLAKPLTESEFNAQQAARLRQEGELTDQMILDTIIGKETPVQIVGPGNVPAFSSPGAAVRTGAQPFINKGAEAKPTNGIAVLADGSRVPAVQGADNRWRHAQTGAELPAEIQIYDIPKPQGSAADVGLGPTTANSTEANRLNATIVSIDDSLGRYEKLLTENPGVAGAPGNITGMLQNVSQVTKELSAAFGDKAPDAAVTLGEIQSAIEQYAPNYDPAIQEARFMVGELAYGLAQLQNPSGEVSRQAYERAIDSLTGGVTANNASALAGVGAYRKLLGSKRLQVEALRNPNMSAVPAPAAPPPPPGGAVRFERGPDGRPVRVK